MSNIFGLTCISSDPGYEGWIFAKHPDGSNWVTCAKMTPETWAMIQPAMAKAESFGAEISEMPIEDLRFCVTIQRIEIDRLRAELAAERANLKKVEIERGKAIDVVVDELVAERAKVERLDMSLRQIIEEWAGSECGHPVYAQEAYAIRIAKRMAGIAGAALEDAVGGADHV